MNNLMSRISEEIEEKAMKQNIMGTKNVRTTLVLTDEEINELGKMDFNEHYNWEREGNELYVIYTQEIAKNKVYVKNLEKEFDLEKLEKEQGTYKYEGNTLWLIQEAYPSDLYGLENNYTALAIDNEGNMYRITWDIIDFETEDGTETCTWNEYSVKTI